MSKGDYIQKKKVLQEKEEELNLLLSQYTNENTFFDEMKQIKGYLKINNLTKEILDYLINRIYIFKDNKIEILWKFKL